MNIFRTLRADEIDCRVSRVTPKWVVLLLYKDARCDQNILDETVGPFNWQRHHSRENANCTVALWDEKKAQWIEKEDTGVESRTEREKGLASDSFKRACFNWGIGRELYTAPAIFVPVEKCNVKDGKCYDSFTVDEIEYQPDGQREICKLTIYNETTRTKCYSWQAGERKAAKDNEPAVVSSHAFVSVTGFSPAKAISEFCTQNKITMKEFAAMRSGLVAAKIVPDISSNDMDLDSWNQLIAAFAMNYPDVLKGKSA